MGEAFEYMPPHRVPMIVEVCESEFEDSLYGWSEVEGVLCTFNDSDLALTINGVERECPTGTVFVSYFRGRSGGEQGHVLSFELRVYPHRPAVAELYQSANLAMLGEFRFTRTRLDRSVDHVAV